MARSSSLAPKVSSRPAGPDWPSYIDLVPGLVRLDNNTNPRPNPVVRQIGRIASRASLNRYGSARAGALRSALAKRFGRPEAQVLVGNGSDEVLDLVARAYLGPGRRAAVLRPTYDLYALFARRVGASVRSVLAGPGFVPPAGSAYARGIDVFFLAAPGAPTGARLSARALRRIAGAVRGIVVVDEAYYEYEGADLWTPGFRLGNVLFVRTFSKAWGLAGLRLGYGVGPEPLIERLARVQTPFTVDSIAERAGLAALEDPAFVRASVRAVTRERPRLARALRTRGFRVFPSVANFLYTYPPVPGPALVAALRARSVLVRLCSPTPACAGPVRVSVGRPAEHRALLTALDRVLPQLATGPGGRP